MADSSTPDPPRLVSTDGSFGPASSAEGPPSSPLDDGSRGAIICLLSDVVLRGSVFFSFSRCSRPSTLFRRASSTSVFGPLFLGTASADGGDRWRLAYWLQHPSAVHEPPRWTVGGDSELRAASCGPENLCTYHICKDIERLGMPRMTASNGCILSCACDKTCSS